jgi:glutaryl-CoA dehydrogenase
MYSAGGHAGMTSTLADLKSLVENLDLKRIATLARHVDLGKLLRLLSELEPDDLVHLASQARTKHSKRPLPAVDGDFYGLRSTLLPEEDAILRRVREFMEREVAPIANDFWLRSEFPHHLIPKLAALDIAGMAFKGYGFPGRSCVLEGFVAEEIARVDVSMSTFFGVQSGLAMGSIYLCGSEEQKQAYLPKMRAFELLGAFGLTEPEVGSGAALGLTTTCRRDGDTWILNGKKKWIGNATFADFTIIWARDVGDGNVKGFLVDRDTPGFTATKIEDKMALRIVQNAEITLLDCRVPEAKRLANASSFKDTARVLRMTRAGVAWQAVGCARGAYEHTVKYVQTRAQFGRPIGSFQMVQDLVAHMLSQLTAMQTMVHRLSQLQDAGELKDEHASLAKVFCSVGCREVVSQARELHGGNGILLSHDVARFVADAEAIYSYEGTKQVNSLIVGRAVTGFSAFV